MAQVKGRGRGAEPKFRPYCHAAVISVEMHRFRSVTPAQVESCPLSLPRSWIATMSLGFREDTPEEMKRDYKG